MQLTVMDSSAAAVVGVDGVGGVGGAGAAAAGDLRVLSCLGAGLDGRTRGRAGPLKREEERVVAIFNLVAITC
jgi:hypothetical protein